MSLLAQVNQPNEGNYYFSLEGGGGGGGSSSTQYTATGAAAAGGFISTGAGAGVILNNGTFVSKVATDAIPAGGTIVAMENAAGLGRWSIGFANSESGGNAGADFAIDNYNDAGAIVGTPLSIDRLTGVVTATGLVSVPSLSQTQSAVISGAIAVGITSGIAMGSFVAPRSGIYLFTAALYMNVVNGVTGFASIGDSDEVGVTIFNIPTGFSTTVSMKPYTMPPTDAVPAGIDYTLFSTVPLLLVAGTTYTISGLTANCSTPNVMAFPSGGAGAGAFFTSAIVPLC